ncbi:type I secretion protein TolC [Neisseria dentiae]|uniref:Type I secretion protein TolC n=1 Tax=Neisseria dentiae TaxID=194197 RepID=A0A1X3D7L9_9NEIS|nr:TolC family protein [Neisseria dentiae]OSI15949.1 type I secretion protein TolC [Neisseria dentiae]QMT45343.1 TolC family protein [Neisseria dentiae]STZ51118.1 periplasmic type I secretion system protein [Neisseria dentiae]
MLKLKTLPLFFLFAFITPAANGFTLLDAWRAALDYSADFSAAKHERNAESEKKNQARAELLPQVSVGASYQRQPYSLSSTTKSYGWNVQATQVLFDRTRFAQYKQGKIAAEMADSRLDGKEDQLRMDVAKAYFDILLNKDKLAAITDEKNAYARQLERAQEMFKQGAATILDTHEAKSGYDAALAKEIDTMTQLQVAENTLANLTGLDPSQISPVKNDKALFDLIGETQEQEWQALAELHNPEWQLQRKTLEDATQALKAAKGSRLPTLTVNGGYQDNYNTYRTQDYFGNSFDTDYRSKGGMLNVQLSVPLFSGGKISSQIREAASREMQNKDLLTATERKVQLAVRQAYQTTRSSKIQTLAQQRLLETNRAKLEATQLGRQVGVRNNLEETQAQQEKADAEQKLAEAKYTYIQAYLQLLQNAGVLGDEEKISKVGTMLF